MRCFDAVPLLADCVPLPLWIEWERRGAERSLVIEELGGKAKVEGFGRLEVCKASFVVSYDRHKVEAIILKLIDLGHYHLADALRSCKKKSARPGVLRILREAR